MRGGIDNLNVVGDDKFFEALGYGAGETRLEIEEQFVLEAVNVEVALQFALCGEKGGVTALADVQVLDVVGDLAIEKPQGIGAQKAEAGAEAQIQDAGGGVESGVFGLPIAVGGDGLLAVDVKEGGTGGLMEIMQQ
jgi:hypothetical protein